MSVTNAAERHARKGGRNRVDRAEYLLLRLRSAMKQRVGRTDVFISEEEFLMSMINKEVSDFKVQAYHNGEFKTVTKADILGKWSVFFFYPADFTFVCPTEL